LLKCLFCRQPGLLTTEEGWATEETFQQLTRPAENAKISTKDLQELT
jgi:hypothetical protein